MYYNDFKELITTEEIDNELRRFIMDVMLIDPYNFCTLCPIHEKCTRIDSPFVCAKKIYDKLIEVDEIPDEEFCKIALTRAFITAIRSNRDDVTELMLQ